MVLIVKREGRIPSARKLLERLDQEAGIYLADELKNAALRAVGE